METEEFLEIDYWVVLNTEEQYSIWPSFKEIPMGWKREGFFGSKNACLEHIESVWLDMRPLSLKKRMEGRMLEFEKWMQNSQTARVAAPFKSQTVEFLLKGEHPFHVYPAQAKDKEFQEALEMGSLHLVFLDTKGQTCLRVDFPPISRSKELKETMQLVGHLELDFVPLICLANLNISSMNGSGIFKKNEK